MGRFYFGMNKTGKNPFGVISGFSCVFNVMVCALFADDTVKQGPRFLAVS